MSTFSLALGRPTLIDRIVARGIATDVAFIAAGAGLTALAAQLVIPLWPVPITGQTFAVLFVGAALGALRGALSLGLYLVLGVFGLPIFADGTSGTLFGSPSGGFIVGFVFAAALTGWFAQHEWDHRVLRTFVSFVAGTVVIYAFGLTWLYVVLGGLPAETMTDYFGTTDLLQATLNAGILPFLIGDTIKALLAAAILPLTWRLITHADDSRNPQ